jgi:XTP/dITP diphosphohydrolase
MQLIFATNNNNKVREVQALVPEGIRLVTLAQVNINDEIPEPFFTLEENAAEKAKTIYKLTNADCFSEDTGLEINALNGEPGVKSARYAGEDRSSQKNIQKVLQKMDGIKDRSAQFRTVICLILKGKEFFFEGVCKGKIITEPSGEEGFGYDPVFVPEGADRTFAQMSLDEKNKYSHRAKALSALVTFLKQSNANKPY